MSVFYGGQSFSTVTVVATSDGDTDLVAAPGAGKTLVLQKLTVAVTTAAAQTFRIEDKGSSPKIFFSAPASLAVGFYTLDFGPLGVAVSEANAALEVDVAAAGVGMTIAVHGYVRTN